MAAAAEARRLWQAPDPNTLKRKRDRAILAVLLGCGLRRRELADLQFALLQQREEHWAIVDLVGKGGHIRTVPMPDWVKSTVDGWTDEAELVSGKLFRCVCRAGKCWGAGVTELQHFRFKHYRHNPDDPNSLTSNNVYTIYGDRNGHIWVGQESGISDFDRPFRTR